MAASTLVLTFTWENGSELKLEANENAAGNITIVEMQENGDIDDLLSQGVSKSLKHYCEDQIDKMHEAMKAT